MVTPHSTEARAVSKCTRRHPPFSFSFAFATGDTDRDPHNNNSHYARKEVLAARKDVEDWGASRRALPLFVQCPRASRYVRLGCRRDFSSLLWPRRRRGRVRYPAPRPHTYRKPRTAKPQNQNPLNP